MTWRALTAEQERRIRATLPKRTPEATVTRVLEALDMAAERYQRHPGEDVLKAWSRVRRERRAYSKGIHQAIGKLEALLNPSNVLRFEYELPPLTLPRLAHDLLRDYTPMSELLDVLARFAADIDEALVGPREPPGRRAFERELLAERVGGVCAQLGISRARAGRLFLIVAERRASKRPDRIGRTRTWVQEGYDRAAQKMRTNTP